MKEKIEKIKKFLKKENYIKTKLFIAFIISAVIACLYTFTRTMFVPDRLFLVTAIFMFLFMHFIFDLKKMYNWIYEFRFYIAVIVFVIGVLLEYSGSSIGVYNEVLQGQAMEKYFTPVLGKYRSIRSDEWVVNTPIFISQGVDKENPYSYFNDNLRGTSTDMFAIVSPAVKDILIIAKPFNIGYLLLGPAKGLSVIWLGKWISLALVSFEFFMLITKKKKLNSLVGMLMTMFSAATAWWNMTEYFMWGMLAIVLIDKYLSNDKIKVKLCSAFGIFISVISFVFLMYPAYQIPFIYIYLAIFIYLCIENRKKYKFKKLDYIITASVIILVALIGIRYLHMSSDSLKATMSTDYPGVRFEVGGDGTKILFSYVYSFLFPFTNIDNPCEFAGMLSFYPIPMILFIVFLIRNKEERKKHLMFFIPLFLVTILFSVYTIFGVPRIVSKVTLLYMTTGRRIAIPLGFTQILMLIYLISNINKDKKIFGENLVRVLSIISSIVLFFIVEKNAPANYFGDLKVYLFAIVTLISMYLLFNIIKEKKNLLILLIILSLMNGLIVNPIQKGISVLTDKPLSKEIQKIIDEDPNNNLWISENIYFALSNYMLASGAKVLNSTNIYPNMEMYKTVLGEDKFNDPETKKIFNRYAHVNMQITKDQNKIELVFQDSVKLFITSEKVKELGIKYILTGRDLTIYNTEDIKFDQIYSEQGVSIYKVN